MIDRRTFKLSIIIPCYNEKNTIEEILNKIYQSLKDYEILNYEILIVDDFSNDGTKALLKNFINKDKIQIYFHDRNLGKGSPPCRLTQFNKNNMEKFKKVIPFLNAINKQFRLLVPKSYRKQRKRANKTY